MNYYAQANQYFVLEKDTVIFFDLWEFLTAESNAKIYNTFSSDFKNFAKKMTEEFPMVKQIFIILAYPTLRLPSHQQRSEMFKSFTVNNEQGQAICDVTFLGEAEFHIDQLYQQIMGLPDTTLMTLAQTYLDMKQDVEILKKAYPNALEEIKKRKMPQPPQ